ncbi:MAG TPA: histidine kinase [Gemmatimonadaceae bacterium]|nr:histidine kinase [Gemmatimonadaceae bacterium]
MSPTSTTERQPRTRLRSAALIVALWSVPAILATVETYLFLSMEGRSPVLWRVLLAQGSGWFTWAALTPLIFAVTRQAPLRYPPRGRELLIHVACFLAAAVVHAFVYTSVGLAVSTAPQESTFMVLLGKSLLGWFPISLMVYAAIVSGGHWLTLVQRERERERRTAALEAQLARAQLQALRMQLHPHFLFNTLNTIATLVREQERDAAVRLLAQLGDVLRQVLRSAGEHEVRLGDELAFTREYLEIEQLRFADRLRVAWDTEPQTLDALVPNLVLQPLVENALRHGIAKRPTAGLLEIGSRREGGRIIIWVRDDGPGLGESASTVGGGVGLTNVRARLAALHGDAAELRIESLPADAGGARATIVLPWRAGVAGPSDGFVPATEGSLAGATEPAGG